MGKLIIGLVLGLVIGLGLGFFGFGAATGIGVATGLSAGICSVATAAADEDLLSDEQIDRVMNRAASELAELRGNAAEPVTGTLEACSEVMAKLAEANE